MEIIQSKQNQKVKLWKSLSTSKGRSQSGTYLLEGWHLVKEAIAAKSSFQAVIGTESQINEHLEEVPHGVPAIIVSDDVAKHISNTENSQGVFAQITIPNNNFDPKYVHQGKWLFLDRLQDPGNVGTLIRSADAAGFDGVALSKDTADLYNPKLVRSMQGSQFHLKVISGVELSDWVSAFKDNGINVYGTAIDENAQDYRTVDYQDSLALIIGNEGHGIDPQILSSTSGNLYIPIKGQAESLNAAVAGSILMFALG